MVTMVTAQSILPNYFCLKNLIKQKMMKKNIGKADRMIRIIAAIIIGILYFTNILTGTIGIIFLVLAAVFILTSFINFCPLYAPFGFKTCKVEKVN